MVGKNESGKTAVLRALAALNPVETNDASTLNEERDYPRRHLVDYESRQNDKKDTVIDTQWVLEAPDVKDIDINIPMPIDVQVSRRYGDSTFTVNCPPCRGDKQTENSPTGSNGLSSSTSDKQTGVINTNCLAKICELVRTKLPKFMYVSHFDRMAGEIQLETDMHGNSTDENEREYSLFLDFLKLAGISMDQILQANKFETFNARLQAASSKITEQILEYWSQNPDIDVEINVSHGMSDDPPPFNTGRIARARIKNTLHKVDTPFSERSAGFVWFFSFLVKFATVKESEHPLVLLLDEPGLSLHGKAQQDLLRYIDEKLEPKHQVLYTTHSPFMIPAKTLNRVRMVEHEVYVQGRKRQSDGTKVNSNFLSVKYTPDSIFPLQAALGYEITQTLFIGSNVLLVEGPSDLIYLTVFSNYLEQVGQTYLDSRWTLCPAGSLDRFAPFVTLFAGNKIKIAVLADIGKGQRQKIRNLRTDYKNICNIYTVAQFLDAQEGDIEDVIGDEIYVEIVNRTYRLSKTEREISVEKLKKYETNSRLVKRIECYFESELSDIQRFSHYRPAQWLNSNPIFLTEMKSKMKGTISTMEKIWSVH